MAGYKPTRHSEARLLDGASGVCEMFLLAALSVFHDTLNIGNEKDKPWAEAMPLMIEYWGINVGLERS